MARARMNTPAVTGVPEVYARVVIASSFTAALTRATRETYRREIIPERMLWWLAGEGMRDWYRVVAKHLAPHLAESGTPRLASMNETRALMARLGARMFERRSP